MGADIAASPHFPLVRRLARKPCVPPWADRAPVKALRLRSIPSRVALAEASLLHRVPSGARIFALRRRSDSFRDIRTGEPGSAGLLKESGFGRSLTLLPKVALAHHFHNDRSCERPPLPRWPPPGVPLRCRRAVHQPRNSFMTPRFESLQTESFESSRRLAGNLWISSAGTAGVDQATLRGRG